MVHPLHIILSLHLFIVSGHTVEKLLTKCITSNLNKNAMYREDKSVVLLRDDEYDLKLNKCKKTSMVIDPALPYLSREVHDANYSIGYYVLRYKNKKALVALVSYLQAHHLWNSRAEFIVYTDVLRDKMVETLWQNSVFKMTFLIPGDNDTLQVYTWYPYSGTKCGDKFSVYYLETCRGVSRTTWFRNKIPDRLGGCTFKLLAFETSQWFQNTPNNSVIRRDDVNRGVEGNMVAVLAEKANIRIEVNLSQVNGDLLLGNLGHNGDIACGGFVRNLKRYRRYDYSLVYQYAAIHWCVPYLLRMKQLGHFLEVISVKALIGASVLYVLLTALYCLVTDQNDDSLVSCAVATFSIMLGQPVPRQPEAHPLRYFFLVATLYGLWFVMLFQTALSSKLALNEREQTYRTVDGFIRADLKIYCYPVIDDVIVKTDPEWGPTIVKRRRSYLDLIDYYDELAVGKQSVFCSTLEDARAVIEKGVREKKGRLLHCFGKSITVESVNFYMSRGFPLRDRMNTIVQRAMESGFLRCWQLRSGSKVKVLNWYKAQKKIRKLHLKLLKPAFVVFFGGCAVAFLCFLLEVFTVYDI